MQARNVKICTSKINTVEALQLSKLVGTRELRCSKSLRHIIKVYITCLIYIFNRKYIKRYYSAEFYV